MAPNNPDFNNFIEDTIETQETTALQQEEARMKEALLDASYDYNIDSNENMDLFQIKIQEIVWTKGTTLEVNWPLDFIPAINDYIASQISQWINWRVFWRLDPTPFQRYWFTPDEYQQDIDTTLATLR